LQRVRDERDPPGGLRSPSRPTARCEPQCRVSIGTELSELIILITARVWTQDYEWYLHAPIALKRGISQEIIDAIAQGQHPPGMNEDQDICCNFSIELHHNKRVSDATYERAVKRFGEKGVLDIAGINGAVSHSR